MINCLIGTRAQLIKMAPVLRCLERRGILYRLIMTGQHVETMNALLKEFGVHASPAFLYQGREITGLLQMLIWFLRCLWRGWRQRNQFFPSCDGGGDVLVVHGDTMSTLLGAILGKLLRMRVAHVEAGLRSQHLFHPFPEELTRLAVSRMADIAFCPGEWAVKNLKHAASRKVDTGENTLIDSVRIALATQDACSTVSPDEAYGVVSIHRFENIFSRRRLGRIVALLETAAQRYRLVFVLHPASQKRLSKFGLLDRLHQNPAITLVPRMGFSDFIKLQANAKFVVSDGGSNQEELHYLGKPTLLMRKATERQEGMGRTAHLCNYSKETLLSFLDSLLESHPPHPFPSTSPSDLIVDVLQQC